MKRTNRTWTDEDFLKAVAESTSISSTLRNLGLCHKGSAHKIFWKHAQRLSVDISHFDPSKSRVAALQKSRDQRMRPDDDIFVENSPYLGSLRQRVFRAGFLEYMCALCGNEGTHCGKALVLQLDHINGVNKDCRRENLRFLCPNCHTQTDTFCGKSHHRKPISPKPKKSRPRRVDYSKVMERYAELKNYVHVAKEFGVSGNAVKKIVIKCEAQGASIPSPRSSDTSWLKTLPGVYGGSSPPSAVEAHTTKVVVN